MRTPPIPPPPRQVRPIEAEDINYILEQELEKERYADVECIRFIIHYLESRDINQASKAAGIDNARAHSFYRKKDVRAAITKVSNLAVTKHGLDPGAIVQRVKEIAFVDPLMLFNADGTIKENMNDIPAEARRAIKKFKVKNLYEQDVNGIPRVVGKLFEVELWDKLKGTELLGREAELFKETVVVQHDATKDMKSILLGAGARAEARALAAREKPVELIKDVTPLAIDVSPIKEE